MAKRKDSPFLAKLLVFIRCYYWPNFLTAVCFFHVGNLQRADSVARFDPLVLLGWPDPGTMVLAIGYVKTLAVKTPLKRWLGIKLTPSLNCSTNFLLASFVFLELQAELVQKSDFFSGPNETRNRKHLLGTGHA